MANTRGASALPVLQWLPAYEIAWLRRDLVAGLTLAAYLLPAGIGDASLAGLPPEAGLYACLFSGLVFWLFCSSRHTVITVTSALSLLIGASVGELSGGDPTRHAALAAGATLVVAGIAFAAWLVRAGSAIGFFSETVLVGFKAGWRSTWPAHNCRSSLASRGRTAISGNARHTSSRTWATRIRCRCWWVWRRCPSSSPASSG